jgi:hypothetical protein
VCLELHIYVYIYAHIHIYIYAYIVREQEQERQRQREREEKEAREARERTFGGEAGGGGPARKPFAFPQGGLPEEVINRYDSYSTYMYVCRYKHREEGGRMHQRESVCMRVCVCVCTHTHTHVYRYKHREEGGRMHQHLRGWGHRSCPLQGALMAGGHQNCP